MTDTTLSLAARLAANLIANAIDITMIAAGGIGAIAAKMGDRLLGGSPFDEREAQRFLTMGGSERLAEAEAEREVWEPGELSRPVAQHPLCRELQEQVEENQLIAQIRLNEGDEAADAALRMYVKIGRDPYAHKPEPAGEKWAGFTPNCSDIGPVNDGYFVSQAVVNEPRLLADDPALGLTPHGFNTMPNWQAPKSSAPVAPKPTDVAGSPGSASTPPLSGADSGHLNQPVGVGVAEPGTGEAGLSPVESVLLAHRLHEGWNGGIYCHCDARALGSALVWWEHISPLISEALQK